ncbi:MAG: pilus assembly protein N-terminal domain-containing protein, partial [Desulfovibrionales bacterium]|nr:pilus assembly protein N-terminal domain-containing protein [Desulfovibrionales bacterium]
MNKKQGLWHKLVQLLIASLALILSGAACAAGILNLGLNEAMQLKYRTQVDTVLISNPEIADYQVVRGNQLIVYGKTVGSTTLVVMDENGKVVDNKTLVVNKSLAHIRQQVKLKYPDHAIEIINLGDQVVL